MQSFKYKPESDDSECIVQLCDTAGEERITYQTVGKNYFRSVDGAIITFDLTQRDTF